MSFQTEQFCTSQNCDEKADVYCEYLAQFFCHHHQEVHDGCASRPHKDIPIDLYQQRQQEEITAGYCKEHTKHEIQYVCVNCKRSLCSECMDRSVVCSRPGGGRGISNNIMTVDKVLRKLRLPSFSSHKPESLQTTVNKLKEEILTKMTDLKTHQLQVTFALEHVQKTVDKQLDYDRDTLDEIDCAVAQLELSANDDKVTDFKKKQMEDMENKRKTLNRLEADVNDFGKNCQKAIQDGEELLERRNTIVLTNAKSHMDALIQLQVYKLPPFTLKKKKIFIEKPSLRNENLPITLKVIYEVLRPWYGVSRLGMDQFYVEMFHTINPKKITLEGDTYAVIHRSDGTLIRAGTCGIYDPHLHHRLPRYGRVTSIYEHNPLLYVAQCSTGGWHDYEVYVHVFNLKTQEDKLRVIAERIQQFQINQIVATSKYICLTVITYVNGHNHYAGENASAVKVYSALDFSYQFNILQQRYREDNKYDETHGHPLGIVVLDDESLVVGDRYRQTVTNLTISKKPEVKWSRVVDQTSSITVDKKNRLIFVAALEFKSCLREPFLAILSYQGEFLGHVVFGRGMLRPLTRIYDISLYKNTLVIACGGRGEPDDVYECEIPEYQEIIELTKS